MSDTVLVALIGGFVPLIGTIITVLSNAAKTRKENNSRLDKIESKIDSHIASDAKESAVMCRSRILRFANDVRRGLDFSKDYWDTIMIDITDYQKFTSEHPDFRNAVCLHAIKMLEDSYDELLANNSFTV